MICYLDKTFCASKDCKNECGRQLTEEHAKRAEELGFLISVSYFCGESNVA